MSSPIKTNNRSIPPLLRRYIEAMFSSLRFSRTILSLKSLGIGNFSSPVIVDDKNDRHYVNLRVPLPSRIFMYEIYVILIYDLLDETRFH